MREDLCCREGEAEGEYVVGTIGGMDAADGECGRSRRCSGSEWIATLLRTSLDAPVPRASNAFILAWRVEGGISGNQGMERESYVCVCLSRLEGFNSQRQRSSE
jgi:hypothetical protein